MLERAACIVLLLRVFRDRGDLPCVLFARAHGSFQRPRKEVLPARRLLYYMPNVKVFSLIRAQ